MLTNSPFSILICLSCCLALSAATLRSPCIFRSNVSIDETTWFVGEPLSTVTWPKGKTWLGWSRSPFAVLLTSGWSLKSKSNYMYINNISEKLKIVFLLNEINGVTGCKIWLVERFYTQPELAIIWGCPFCKVIVYFVKFCLLIIIFFFNSNIYSCNVLLLLYCIFSCISNQSEVFISLTLNY